MSCLLCIRSEVIKKCLVFFSNLSKQKNSLMFKKQLGRTDLQTPRAFQNMISASNVIPEVESNPFVSISTTKVSVPS